MPHNRRRFFFGFPFIIIAGILLAGYVVMLLWNFVFPAALHAERITYWQAVALFVLCRILFFGFRSRHAGQTPGMWRRGGPPWRQKWMNMSEEDRVKFRQEWQQRCRKPGEQKD